MNIYRIDSTLFTSIQLKINKIFIKYLGLPLHFLDDHMENCLANKRHRNFPIQFCLSLAFESHYLLFVGHIPAGNEILHDNSYGNPLN